MSDIKEGQTATNPKTGQKIVFKGGQWRNAGGPTAAAPGRPLTANQAVAAKQKATNLIALQNKLRDVRERYGKDLKGVGLGSILEYLPTPRNRAFDSAAAGLSDLALASFRVPGVGAQSDTELRAFIQANQPRASDPDEQIEAKLSNIENRVNAAVGPDPGFQIVGRRAR